MFVLNSKLFSAMHIVICCNGSLLRKLFVLFSLVSVNESQTREMICEVCNCLLEVGLSWWSAGLVLCVKFICLETCVHVAKNISSLHTLSCFWPALPTLLLCLFVCLPLYVTLCLCVRLCLCVWIYWTTTQQSAVCKLKKDYAIFCWSNFNNRHTVPY